MSLCPDTPPAVALTVVTPLVRALARPLGSTEATSDCDDAQAKTTLLRVVPWESRATAISRRVSSIEDNEVVGGLTETVAMCGVGGGVVISVAHAVSANSRAVEQARECEGCEQNEVTRTRRGVGQLMYALCPGCTMRTMTCAEVP